MLKTKITKSLTLKTLIPDLNKAFLSDEPGQRKLMNAIKDTITSGKSPVAGYKFVQYSSSYADRFKGGARKPVNMTLTGEMLKSMKVVKTRSSFAVVIDSEIADYHNRLGAGKKKVIRRLLPTNRGERFKVFLQKIINKMANSAASKATKKQNR
jgi:hypothetical protein